MLSASDPITSNNLRIAQALSAERGRARPIKVA